MKRLTLAVCLLLPFFGYCQNTPDSLTKLLLKKDLRETDRIDIMNALAYKIRASEAIASYNYAHDALNESREINYKKGEGQSLLIVGDHHLVRSEYDKSMTCGLHAIDIFEGLHDRNGLMHAYYLLSFTYASLADSAKFRDYFNRSLAIAEETNNKEMLARLYGGLGNTTSMAMRNPSKTLSIYLKALSYIEHDEQSVVKVILLGNIGATYQRLGEFAKALEFLHEGERIAKIQNNKRGGSLIHLMIGEDYLVKRDYVNAEKHIKIGHKLALESGVKKALLDAYISFIGLHQEMGQFEKAHDYQRLYAKSRDSIFNREKSQQISELEIKHETEKKEQQIENLEQEKKIHNLWRVILIIGLVVTALVAYLIYRLQRSRTEKAQQLLKVQHVLNEKLKELDKIKTQFFANISHEFRTPLTLILAPLEGLLKKKSLEKEEETLILMKRNANRLLELITQLLDLSKIEAKKMNLRVSQNDIEHFFRTIGSSFESLAEHNQVTFVQQYNIDSPLQWFDRDKLEKVTMNLLSNAFKVTSIGDTVTLAVTVSPGSSETLSLVVEDTGPGIPKEDQHQIFAPFYQIQQAKGNFTQGTGLGLSLTRELVRLYDGKIELVSSAGQGTKFTVTLPLQKTAFHPDQIEDVNELSYILPDTGHYRMSAPLENATEYDSSQEGKDTILIVEDNLDLLKYMQSILNTEFIVVTATDGDEALQLAFKQVPNLVLSDLMMPRVDGIELTKELKSDLRTSHIPVILLTARNEVQSRLEGLKTGADDYLTKPFAPEELLVRIQNLIGQRKKLAILFQERVLVPPTTSAEPSLDDKFLLKVRDAIDANISDFTFSVDLLADEVGMSRTQLLRKLKALTGLSPSDFIKDMRLKKAADKIIQKADTITRIGYMVGFSDQSYFTKCFKRKYGVNPSEYTERLNAPAQR